jgi:hypothetical protein
VGFALTRRKQGKLPELARYRYKIQLDVEETKVKAESRGFTCRLLEGLPKNRKGLDGYGEPYPLPQYEITGANLPDYIKIEIVPPKTINAETMEPILRQLESYCQELERVEEIMNEIAVFCNNNLAPAFSIERRIYTKTPAMYRLIIASRDITDQLLDNIMKIYWSEFDKAIAELSQGNFFQARRRLDQVENELEFFFKSLISTARQMKDPRVDKWEADFNNAKNAPLPVNNRNFLGFNNMFL